MRNIVPSLETTWSRQTDLDDLTNDEQGPYDHPMPNYPPGGYDTLGVPQQYAEQPFEVATEVIIEGSEREKQAKVDYKGPFF